MEKKSDQKRLEQQMDFLREMDKSKEIFRQNYLADGSRKENDAEHAWYLALMALILREYANEEVDLLHVICLVLIHDAVEIDAGDTYAYDKEGMQDKRERESRAADRIFSLLPPDQAALLQGLWEEFEAEETMESKFANALDKFSPAYLNHVSGGKSWVEHGVTFEQVMERNSRTGEGAKALWVYLRGLLESDREKGLLRF